MDRDEIIKLPVIVFHGEPYHTFLVGAETPIALKKQIQILEKEGWIFPAETKMIRMGKDGPCYKAAFFPIELLIDHSSCQRSPE